MSERPVRLVYVLGSGRCGSTLLDVVLGAHPEIRSVGEFDKVPHPAWLGDGDCSCGRAMSECPFWSHVRSRFEESFSSAELLAGQRRFERYRSLPYLVLSRLLGLRGLKRHCDVMVGLANAVREEAGAEAIVDSSKNPVRGLVWLFCRRSAVEPLFIHLVRDGRGFVRSRQKHASETAFWNESTPRLSLLWVLSNLAATVLFSFHRSRYIRIRYEDLISKPASTLQRIGDHLGIDLGDQIRRLTGGGEFDVEHLAGGNSIRYSSALVLRPDTEWVTGLDARDQRTFWRIAGPLARLYGYDRNADASC